MNGEQFLTRYNIMTINNITSFAGIRGGMRQNCKDVYFIRGIGCNDSYLEDIMSMDQMLYTREVQGTGSYLRLGELPKPCMPDEMDRYIRIYEEWKTDTCQEIRLDAVRSNKELGKVLSSACKKVSLAFCQFTPGASESMMKNFMVKIFYWADSGANSLLKSWRAEAGGKFVLTCNIKKQEFLFCYLLSLLGIDVLILSPEGELGVDNSLLGLSKRMELGDCRTANIPGYHPEIYEENKSTRSFEDGLVSKEPETSEISDVFQRQDTWERQNGGKETDISARPAGSAASKTAPIRVVIPGRNRGKSQAAGGQSPREAGGQRPGGAAQAAGGQRPGGATQSEGVQRPGGAAQAAGVQPPVAAPALAASRQIPREPVFQAGVRQELAFEQLARLASSIVMISVKDKSGKGIGSGSGIMVGAKGYILTNFHVVNGGTNFSVQIEDDQKMYETDELIKYNHLLDMALIRINRRLDPIPVYKGSQPLVRGQKVVAIGSPLGLFNSVSDGIISGFRNMDEVDMIQFTAPISHGSSGGAVLNMFGEVVGISTAGIDSGQNLNLAVDYRSINPFIRGFIQDGSR